MEKGRETWRVKAARVDAIQARRDVERLRRYYISKHRHGRVYALVVTLGCNFGLRASDLLKLRVGDLRGKTHLEIKERKTGKTRRMFINGKVHAALNEEWKKYIYLDDEAPVFESRKGMTLTVKSLHRIIKQGCREIGLEGNYGSHSLRKTFAYHAYAYTGDMNAIKGIMNHSDISVTRAYVNGEKHGTEVYEGSEDEIYSSLNL